MDSQRRKAHVALLSVISNSLLVAMKLTVGLIIGSVSIMSEAIHSGVDLIASFIALFSVKTANIPADTKHPFGHGKVENISGSIEAILIFVAAGWIIFEAVKKFFIPQPIEYVGWGIGIMLISTVTNIVVSHMLFKVGKETESVALQADAWHLRTDVYTSAAVMTSLAVIWFGHRIVPDPKLHWLDPAAAILVALMIMRAAYRLTVQSARDLMDVKLPAAEEAWIDQHIRERQDTIRGYHHLRTRKAGNIRFIEFHLKVDPGMSVEASHHITEELTESIKMHFPDVSVTIHIEPCNGNCLDYCIFGCFLNPEERSAFAVKVQPREKREVMQ